MWHVLSVTTLASFLAGLNARLAVVGLPTIAESLKADLEQAFWITQGFMLGSTAVQLVAGRLADLYGRVRLFSFGFILFAVGALLSGLSPSPIAIIASRIVQGAGSAFLMSLSVVILTDNAPKERLGTWLGVNQTAWRAGAIVGLSVSGFVIDLLGWRWLFLGQVPIALASYFWARSRLEEAYRPAEEAVVDWAGFFLFTTAVSALLAGLTLYVYGSHRLLSYALLASVPPLLAGFALYELKAEAPAMDLRIFRNWQYTGGVIAGTLYSVAFGATSILLSLYLQTVRGLSATATGLALLPFEATYMAFGVAGGRLSDRFGFVPVTIAGLAAGSLALYLLGALASSGQAALPAFIAATCLFGVGTGLFSAPNTSSVMSAVEPHRRGVASSVRGVLFNVGFTASLNMAVLSISTAVPFEEASALIAGSASVPADLLGLARGIGRAFWAQAVAMALAIPFSASRRKASHGGRKAAGSRSAS